MFSLPAPQAGSARPSCPSSSARAIRSPGWPAGGLGRRAHRGRSRGAARHPRRSPPAAERGGRHSGIHGNACHGPEVRAAHWLGDRPAGLTAFPALRGTVGMQAEGARALAEAQIRGWPAECTCPPLQPQLPGGTFSTAQMPGPGRAHSLASAPSFSIRSSDNRDRNGHEPFRAHRHRQTGHGSSEHIKTLHTAPPQKSRTHRQPDLVRVVVRVGESSGLHPRLLCRCLSCARLDGWRQRMIQLNGARSKGRLHRLPKREAVDLKPSSRGSFCT